LALFILTSNLKTSVIAVSLFSISQLDYLNWTRRESLFTGLDYWTGLLDSPKMVQCRSKANHVYSAWYQEVMGSCWYKSGCFPAHERCMSFAMAVTIDLSHSFVLLAHWANFTGVSRSQRSCAYL